MPDSSILFSVLLLLVLWLSGPATSEIKCSSNDRVALIGQVTNFTFPYNNGESFQGVVMCVGDIGGIIIGFSDATDQQLKDRNISWHQETNKFTFQILATVENNNTEVYGLIGSSMRTDSSRLIVVESPPSPPVAPSVTVTNLTALTLTWTAPWPFPVINYTVTMLNLTSNQITQWTTCDEQLVLRGGGQCDELVFTVEVETDVGSTGPSINTTSGFPKGLDTTARKQTNVTIVCDRNTNILHAAIQVPEVCPYEALAVTLVLTDVLDGGTIVYGPTNQLMFDVSSDNITSPLSCNSTYNVSLVVENQASQRITINTVYTNTTTSQAVTTPTPTSQVESTVSNWITIGIPVIMSIIILIIIIVTITIMAAAFVRHSSKQHKNAPVELDEKERQDNDYEIKT